MIAEPLNLMAAAPELVLLIGACVVLLADLFVPGKADAQHEVVQSSTATYVLSLLVMAAVAGTCVYFLSAEWTQYAFGGMYVTDPMANVLKIVACLVTALALIYGQGYARDRGLWKGELFTLSLFMLLGALVMISANNMLVIYLGLELQALSLYALVALRRDDVRATEAAMKYFVLGALASGFLLYGISMLYGATGTLDINELKQVIDGGRAVGREALVLGTVFIVAGLAFKLGAVPFHMWVPDVYHGAPTPVTALIGSTSKVAAFAIAYRILVEGLLSVAIDWQKMLIVLSVASLVIGNVTAIAQSNLKRMLAYSAIGQIGFMLLAMASAVNGAPDTARAAGAYSAAMFYVVTYAVTTLGTFGIIMLLARQGLEAEEISDLRGLNKRSPWYAFVMLLLMFSLAGVPPTVGFYAKLVVLQALLDGLVSGAIWLAVIAVMLSLVAAFYYLRVVKTMYFDEPADSSPIVATQDMRIALSFNGLFVLVLGVLPQYLLALCTSAMAKALGG